MKIKQKENSFKMHNIFNKDDVAAKIHNNGITNNNSKMKRLQKHPKKNVHVGTIKNLKKGNLKLFDIGIKNRNEEKDYIEEVGKSKSTRNVLYCNNNTCHRIINNIDGKYNLNLCFY